MKANYETRRFFTDAATMLLVSGLSLFLLIYIGFAEAQRSYLQLYFEKLEAQGQIMQNAMENVLRPGLPLKQYVGFNTLAQRILAADPSISGITAFDLTSMPVFHAGERLVPLRADGAGETSIAHMPALNSDYLQVILPLSNRFEHLGYLAISVPRAQITARIEREFTPLLLFAGALSIGFSLFAAMARGDRRQMRWRQLGFAATFLVMSLALVATLIMLYSDGTQAKTRALADTLGQRLVDIVSFNLVIGDITGLESLFSDYKRLNPDIQAAALLINDTIEIHTDPAQVGKPWVRDPTTHEYLVDLTPPDSVREIRIAVALPADIVLHRTLRSIKNFAALFIASAFLAGLFLQLAATLPNLYPEAREAAPPGPGGQEEALLNLAKPVFFVAVFIEHLTYAFLPQFIDRIVLHEGLSSAYLSLPFIVFYLSFALSLVPAGHIAEQFTPRPLMYGGMLLSAIGIGLLMLPPDIHLVILARCVAGLGQGILLIGVQSYILNTVSPSRRTQGVSIIVFGFQGGMISGLAIGSLLVPHVGEHGVFLLSAGVGALMTLYTLLLVPELHAPAKPSVSLRRTFVQLGRNMWQVSRSLRFLKAMLLIGIPAKTVLTGVIIFALPLILAQNHFHHEDIGQIIMVYGVCVLLSTHYFARLVDRLGQSRIVLFWGSVISGVGILLIGLVDWPGTPYFAMTDSMATAVLIAGVSITGFAHGLINAPVVTHIANSNMAQRIGSGTATATYRFMERIGHVAGPMLIGQLFVLGGQNSMLLLWVGGIIILFGLLFVIGQENPQAPVYLGEQAR